jgi:hypothetical protein
VFPELAGLGLATAVFVDATMALLGDRNLGLPLWLQGIPDDRLGFGDRCCVVVNNGHGR